MKTVLGLLALVAAAGTAGAQITATAAPLDAAPGFDARATPVFSAIPGPYAAFGAASGFLGFDDYDTILAGGSETLTELRFVGGVTAVGGIIDFNFYDSTGANLLSTFNAAFGSAGNFIWTITGLSNLIADQGRLELVARPGTNAQWFLSTSAPTLGTEDRAVGTLTSHSHRFELSIPAPGSLALLGLGGLVIGRRRR